MAKTLRSPKTMLITGGAGFIGVNAVRYFLMQGWNVVVFDNFSRKGTDANIRLLKREVSDVKGKLKVVRGDVVTGKKALDREVSKADVVIHLAAQVAVTTSIINPRDDFKTNVIGTFNTLEAVRRSKKKPIFLYSSTNKVYGSLPHLSIKDKKTRHVFVSKRHATHGVSEAEQLDFHSPYGCSKGAADQYVIDYSRIYGLRSVVFRQSCVFGPYQFGVEDQGWVAWLTIAALFGRPITIYGTGKQVRDVLYVEDLIRLYDLAIKNIAIVSGNAYNVGGGPQNTISLVEFLAHLEEQLGVRLKTRSAETRAGDQPIFVADIRKLKRELRWEPRTGIFEGWEGMYAWILQHQEEIRKTLAKSH